MSEKRRTVWIDAMGAPEVIIEATFDFDGRRVLVDSATLAAMADGTYAAQMLDEDDTAALVKAIRTSARDGELYDVTEVGGGFAYWTQNIVEAEGTADYSVFVPASPNPRDELRRTAAGLDGIDAGSAIVAVDDGGEHLTIDFEGNRYHAVNLATFAQCVEAAVGRADEHYPTVARRTVPRDSLIAVGRWDRQGYVALNGNASLLVTWLGGDTLDPRTLVR